MGRARARYKRSCFVNTDTCNTEWSCSFKAPERDCGDTSLQDKMKQQYFERICAEIDKERALRKSEAPVIALVGL